LPYSSLGGAANQAISGLVSAAASKGIAVDPGKNLDVNVNFTGLMTDPKTSLSLGSSSGGAAESLKDQAKAKLEAQKAELENKAREAADKAKAEAEKAKAEAEAKAKAEADKIKAEAKRKADEQAAKQKQNLQNEAKKKLNGLVK